MPSYKLHYFPLRCRGEAIRFIFYQVGVSFEDHAITFDEWPKLKPGFPMGQLPVLEVDGKQLCQTMAIARYLANKFGLAGKTEWEKAEADMIVAGVEECMNAFVPYIKALLAGDNAKMDQELANFKDGAFKTFLGNYTKLLSNKGWFVGNEATWADLVVAEFLDRMQQTIPKALDDHATLKTHREKVFRLPKIAEWVAKRPDYPF